MAFFFAATQERRRIMNAHLARRRFGLLFAGALLVSGSAFGANEDDVRAVFDRFVTAQNAHDVAAVRDLLLDSPSFLWITRGSPIWGREAALKRFEALYQGTWKLTPDNGGLKVIVLSDTTAQLFVPIMFNIGAAGQPAPDAPILMNQTLVKTASGWRVASILPIPLPPVNPAPAK
jgi:ketosteroid isomerase-like protein